MHGSKYKARRRGSIAILVAAAANRPNGNFPIWPSYLNQIEYRLASVVALTRNLAVAYGKRGINVNCVCPGIVETEMWAKIEREAGPLLGLKPGHDDSGEMRVRATTLASLYSIWFR